MTSPAGALALPAGARRHLFLCVGGGLAVALGASATLPKGLDPLEWRGVAAGAALLAVTSLLLQVRSPALNWRGKTIGIHLDEGVVLVGFVVLPPPVVVLAAVASTFASQAFFRKHPLKAAFNTAVQALSSGAAAVVFTLLVERGAPVVGAAVAVPFVAAAVGLSLVGMLLCLLEGEPAWRAFRPALLASVATTSVVGVTGGILALGLYAFHPLALLLLFPLGFLLHKAVVSEYRHQNELTTRRALERAHERLVSGQDVDAIVAAGVEACKDALDLLSCEVSAHGRKWEVAVRDPAGPVRVLRAPLLDGAGELRATVAWNGDVRLQEDEGSVRLIAGSLSMALATAAALRSLREAQKGLRDVLDAAQEPILAWDPEGQVVHQNEAARVLLGGTSREALPAMLEPASAEAFRAAMSARADASAEVEVRTLSGRVLEMRRSPITLAGDRTGALLVARDVTEKRRLEAEAQAHRESMGRTERLASLGILAAGVAHEVNSPLMFMQGNLEMTILDLEDMEVGSSDPRLAACRDQLGTALRGVDRIARITRGLGALGRPDRTLPKAGCDLNDAVRRACDEATRSAPEGIARDQRLAAEPLPVPGDAQDLRQVAFALVRNAVEAMGDAGRVSVTTRRLDEATAELVVEDDGPGVPESDVPKLFTPFHTTKADGTGLGLPIALALARSIGGDVAHEPRPQGGALFRARFPLRPSGAARPPRPQEVF